MKPVRLDRPQEIKPGYTLTDKGSTIEIRPGKHGEGDLQVRVNGRPISHRIFATAMLALYVAEDRYKKANDHTTGGEYFVTQMGSWVYWARTHLGYESLVPGQGRPFG